MGGEGEAVATGLATSKSWSPRYPQTRRLASMARHSENTSTAYDGPEGYVLTGPASKRRVFSWESTFASHCPGERRGCVGPQRESDCDKADLFSKTFCPESY